MSNNIFTCKGGLFFDIKNRSFGFQDRGVSPGGAQDQLSFNTAWILLGNPIEYQAIEMIYPSEIIIIEDAFIVVSGAEYEQVSIDGITVSMNKVLKLSKGQKLTFSGNKKGLRTSIVAVKYAKNIENFCIQRSSDINDYVKSHYSNSTIRVIAGPEAYILNDDSFYNQYWRISTRSSQMGLSLMGEPLDTKTKKMISQPVCDGTIQLSPGGPIVLMRHRQTIGGYPRIANVIELDINKLAQFSFGAKVRFKLITLDQAVEITKDYHAMILAK